MPGIAQVLLYFAVLAVLAVPLGKFIARVMEGEKTFLSPVFGWLEKLCYRLIGTDPAKGHDWKQYAVACIVFNAFGCLTVYALQRIQFLSLLNPAAQKPVEEGSALNTAVSFITNTNWQGYGGESTMSYLTQMLGLGVQNFLSAATGIAVMCALVRGLRNAGSRRADNTGKAQDDGEAATLGNFWADMVRSTVYVLLPLSLILSLVLVQQGSVQSFQPYASATLISPTVDSNKKAVTTQDIPLGPAASQIAIKQLGTNGGGFFNVNSAHPFENPTGLSNFIECLSIILIPVALCITFGEMVRDKRQGRALLVAMGCLLVLFLVPCVAAERAGNPALTAQGLTTNANWEGKEARIGVENSALWAVVTTATSNGSVNAMHDSFTPLGGMMPMAMIQLGEVVFGGVGTGIYSMLVFAIIAVFVAGLMVGRTPEYVGKKIEPFEMKMASLIILIPCCLVLLGTALPIVFNQAAASVTNPGPHGFSQILYAYSSMANNNGSAFAGFNANMPIHNWAGALVMWIGRYWVIVPTLAIAGSLARKRIVPAGPGTLPTHTGLFIGLLCGVVLIVGALTFIPALALGPIAEHLQLMGAR